MCQNSCLRRLPSAVRRILLHKSNAKCGLLCDLIRLEGAEALAHYGKDFYAGSPAATKHNFGKGAVYYTGTQPDKEGLARLSGGAAAQASVNPLLGEETALEMARRVKDGNTGLL